MSTHVEPALRNALSQIADEPPPAGLAELALRTARRSRRTRIAVTGIAVVAALLAAPMAMSSLDRSLTASQAESRPLVITAYNYFQGSQYLDRATGEYLSLPYTILPSPDGRRALVADGASFLDPPTRIGVLDLAGGTTRWLDYQVPDRVSGNWAWSPDGEQVLITEPAPAGEGSRVVIIDVDTLAATPFEYDGVAGESIAGYRHVWLPTGDGTALTVSRFDPPTVTGIRFYDLAGNPVRTIPATAALVSEAAFSPDGTRIVLQDKSLPRGPIQIVDAATGEVHTTLAAVPEADDFLAWAGDHHLVLRAGGHHLRVVDLDGNVVDEIQFPGERPESTALEVHVGPAAGLDPSAAELTFGIP